MFAYLQNLVAGIKKRNLYIGLAVVVVLIVLWCFFVRQSPSAISQVNSDDSGEGELEGGDISDKKLVLYYTNWCGHCNALKPTWDELTAKYNEKQVGGHPVVILKVDAEAEPEKVKELDIKGFPTVVLFKDGKTVYYSGDRSLESLVNFLHNN